MNKYLSRSLPLLVVIPALLGATPAKVSPPPSAAPPVAPKPGFPAHVRAISLSPGKPVSVEGKLDTGIELKDLSWASRDDVKCFQPMAEKLFRARHVLYHLQLPAGSKLKISVSPKNLLTPLSLYAYQLEPTRFDTVPSLGKGIICQAAHGKPVAVMGHEEKPSRRLEIEVQKAVNLVVGVSGPASSTGDFSLHFELSKAP